MWEYLEYLIITKAICFMSLENESRGKEASGLMVLDDLKFQ